MRGALGMQKHLMRAKIVFKLTSSFQTVKEDKNTFQQIQCNITNISL